MFLEGVRQFDAFDALSKERESLGNGSAWI